MRTAPEAVAAAKAAKTNTPGMCQNWTWNLFQAKSVGDVDHDGDADAVDGWKSEPTSAKFTDRKPMIGAPVAWSGGSGGFGHRAICVGYSSAGVPQIRSTDAGGRGVVATRSLDWFEKNWGMKYLGWSKTISGMPIKGLVAAPKPSSTSTTPMTRGYHADKAIEILGEGKKLCAAGSDREALFTKGISQLRATFPLYPKS